MKKQNQKVIRTMSLLRLMLYRTNNFLIRVSSAIGGLESLFPFFYKPKAPGFATLAREFYSNMVEMKEDSEYVRGVWVPFGRKRINEVFQLKELKHGSKFKKLVEKSDHAKIINLLTTGQGKWEATKKNTH